MNEAKFLNNKAILYLKKGDAFEACNVLTEASSICLAEFSQMAANYYTVKRKSSSVIQWVNVQSNTTTTNNNSNSHHHHHPNDSNDDTSHHGLFHYSPAFDTVCACSHRRQSTTTTTSTSTSTSTSATSTTTTSPPSASSGSENPAQQTLPNTTTTTTTTTTTNSGKKRCRQCIQDDALACPCNVAPIVWYNLALTCQLLGSELGGRATTDGSFYLSRSIYWYEKVLTLWKSTAEPNTLIMAILNNVSCIYLDSGRHYDYKTSMLRLKKTLHNRSRPWTLGSAVHNHHHHHHNQWRIFHMNVSLMNNPRPAAAA